MSRRWFIGLAAWCVLLAGAAPIRAQVRFEVVSHDAVPIVPALEIVTVRDNTLSVCYTVFTMAAPPLVQSVAPLEPISVDAAETERDRRWSELSADLEKALVNATPGTLGPNLFTYEREAMKAQVKFEQVARQTDLARLEARLKQIVDARHLAVAGPMACTARDAPSRRDQQ